MSGRGFLSPVGGAGIRAVTGWWAATAKIESVADPTCAAGGPGR
jgi:hypothetical protein